MPIHPTIAEQMRKQADEFRTRNELVGGYVTVDPDDAIDGAGTWTADLGSPADWVPNAYFVPEDPRAPIMLSVGGDGDRGAERFEEVKIST